MCLHPRRRQPVDMWTSPHPCGPARAETCGQPVDRAERREKTITRRSSAAHRLPTLSGLSTTYPQAQQQVVFKEDRRGALRNIVPIVDRSKHISLPVVDGSLAFPQLVRSAEDGFVRRVQVSGKKWVILTNPDGTPQLLLNADRFLRAVCSEQTADPRAYCALPIITNDPHATLEQTLMNAELTDKDPSEKGLILFWGTEKRIIAHADLLRRLFEGVLSAPPNPDPA